MGDLGDRMKRYDAVSQLALTSQMPLIVRVDGRAFHFSHQEVHELNKRQLHEKLFTEKGVNWAHLPTHLKRGTCVYKAPRVVRGPNETTAGVIRTVWAIDREPPVFTQDREYIDRPVFIDSGVAELPRQKNETEHDE